MIMIEKLLLVDDDKDMNYLHSRILEKTGLIKEVCIKKNGQEALEYLRENENNLPELIFLDINMPIMGGWKVVEELEKAPINNLNKSRIFILTSSINPEDFERAENNQFVEGIVEKYLSGDKLKGILGLQ